MISASVNPAQSRAQGGESVLPEQTTTQCLPETSGNQGRRRQNKGRVAAQSHSCLPEYEQEHQGDW